MNIQSGHEEEEDGENWVKNIIIIMQHASMVACCTCIIIVYFSYNIYEKTVDMFENVDQRKKKLKRKVDVSFFNCKFCTSSSIDFNRRKCYIYKHSGQKFWHSFSLILWHVVFYMISCACLHETQWLAG